MYTFDAWYKCSNEKHDILKELKTFNFTFSIIYLFLVYLPA